MYLSLRALCYVIVKGLRGGNPIGAFASVVDNVEALDREQKSRCSVARKFSAAVWD